MYAHGSATLDSKSVVLRPNTSALPFQLQTDVIDLDRDDELVVTQHFDPREEIQVRGEHVRSAIDWLHRMGKGSSLTVPSKWCQRAEYRLQLHDLSLIHI